VARAGRAEVWELKRDYDKAITDYTEAIRLNPKSANLYIWRAYTWEEKGNPEKAAEDYAAALQIDRADKYARAGYIRTSLAIRAPAERD
jgi:tetratricopeptide (TPR) repeat protein